MAQESAELREIENTLAALSIIGEAVAILLLRHMDRLSPEDKAEFQTIVEALERARSYQQALRAPISQRYQRGRAIR